jgi:hypothetical protein
MHLSNVNKCIHLRLGVSSRIPTAIQFLNAHAIMYTIRSGNYSFVIDLSWTYSGPPPTAFKVKVFEKRPGISFNILSYYTSHFYTRTVASLSQFQRRAIQAVLVTAHRIDERQREEVTLACRDISNYLSPLHSLARK